MSNQVCWTSNTKNLCVLYNTQGELYPQGVSSELCSVKNTPLCKINEMNKYILPDNDTQPNIETYLTHNNQQCNISNQVTNKTSIPHTPVPLVYCLGLLQNTHLAMRDSSENDNSISDTNVAPGYMSQNVHQPIRNLSESDNSISDANVPPGSVSQNLYQSNEKSNLRVSWDI